ncbi:hypothetical protein [Streptomyces luteolus]|uniref:Uncharacterized protein n=1 Tax=Streptomyces luteolus TaxID=3043615 RepID=A0ABT6SZU0_9ACTN|nr:hypothetical protein [Streptomyces sp. B-S-A12]MDI3420890.1 hypothetical protein [Streptomyces sp. B-S-A12]
MGVRVAAARDVRQVQLAADPDVGVDDALLCVRAGRVPQARRDPWSADDVVVLGEFAVGIDVVEPWLISAIRRVESAMSGPFPMVASAFAITPVCATGGWSKDPWQAYDTHHATSALE